MHYQDVVMLIKPNFGDHWFAIKEHEAWRLHWDVRVHIGGESLLSWFLRESPHLDPARPQPATWSGYHKSKYLFSERIIIGHGAGPTVLFDNGLCRVRGNLTIHTQFDVGHLRLFFMGARLRGNFSMKWTGPGEDDWTLFKEDDKYADPRRKFPHALTPEMILELGSKKRPKKDPHQMLLL
jgi:hypothetical protein